MRTIFSCILMAMLFVFSGCNESCECNNELSLYQTQWSGVLQFRQNGRSEKCDIYIAFETVDRGQYQTDNLPQIHNYNTRMNFNYRLEGTIVSIISGSYYNILEGKWWIEKWDKRQIVLKMNPTTQDEYVLTLKKI